jgi:hypothetical protein
MYEGNHSLPSNFDINGFYTSTASRGLAADLESFIPNFGGISARLPAKQVRLTQELQSMHDKTRLILANK